MFYKYVKYILLEISQIYLCLCYIDSPIYSYGLYLLKLTVKFAIFQTIFTNHTSIFHLSVNHRNTLTVFFK